MEISNLEGVGNYIIDSHHTVVAYSNPRYIVYHQQHPSYAEQDEADEGKHAKVR